MEPLYKSLPGSHRNSIQVALDRHDIGIAQLARMAGVTGSFASRIVNGVSVPSRDVAERIGDLLGIDPAQVMWPYGREKLARALHRDLLGARHRARQAS